MVDSQARATRAGFRRRPRPARRSRLADAAHRPRGSRTRCPGRRRAGGARWLQQRQRGCPIAVHAVVGLGVGAQQPGPDRALVIASVAADRIAAVVAAIGRIVGTERAQPEVRQQRSPDGVDNAGCCAPSSSGYGSETAKIWFGRSSQFVAVRTIHDVGQVAEILSEEARTETGAHASAESVVIVAEGCITARDAAAPRCCAARCTRAPGSRRACRSRGVTTQSPTLASIQVSCTPGSPARSRPSAGSTPMP